MNRAASLSMIVLLAVCHVSFGYAQVVSEGTKTLPLPGESLQLDGHEAFIIPPSEKTHSDTPWVWYAPTLKGLPGQAEKWMFEQFSAAGIAVAGIDVGESYGSPKGRQTYQAFYDYLIEEKQFHRRPVLLARSRGGLMLYSWAADHADSVAAVAGIYPVCNLESYPGLEKASAAYELSATELGDRLTEFNPIDRLSSLAKANVPLFHIHGDQDRVVPLDSNSGLLAKRYKQLGGNMNLEVVEGQGHNMWSGWFQSQKLTDFVIAHATQDSKTARTDSQHPVPASDKWLRYVGNQGPGKGKHVVLIAADQEYRSEQSMPMLAKILSQHHGFHCTVLFSVNDQDQVDPTLPAPFKDKTKRHRIPGLQYLADADCVIWLSRFMHLPDDQKQLFHDYFDSGNPLIALRTANHGFWGGMPYQVDGKKVSLRDMLGGTFMGHHGGWHREATRGIPVEENEDHPILKGVKDIWGTSDVYRCHNDRFPFPSDCTSLVLGQPLKNLERDAEPNTDKEPLPIAWTKTWTGDRGLASRIFHFTMGSAVDFQNEGVRRLTVNAVFWGLGMEDEIKPDLSVDIIGPYEPLKAGFNYEKLGVQPRPVEFYQ